MNIIDVIILIVVIVIFLAIIYLRVVKKQGGCASCSSRKSCEKKCVNSKTKSNN